MYIHSALYVAKVFIYTKRKVVLHSGQCPLDTYLESFLPNSTKKTATNNNEDQRQQKQMEENL